MAPAKKLKSASKRYAAVNDISMKNDSARSNKSKQKKQKLADLLGPEWSKLELTHFYDAYRKHGKDWKKVANAVRNRSVEMVEAIYNMNRAYLSLPEGTASVMGLIAMMTDHYNVLEGGGSDVNSDDSDTISQKPRKYSKAKNQAAVFKDGDMQPPVASSDGGRCMSLQMHLSGIHPYIPVRRRTPRIPVSTLDNEYYLYNLQTPTNKGAKSVGSNLDNNGFTHGEKLFANAHHNVSSPEDSPTSRKRMSLKSSDMSFVGKLPKEVDAKDMKSNGAREGSVRVTSYWRETGPLAFSESKGKKGERLEVEDDDMEQFYDIAEDDYNAGNDFGEGLLRKKRGHEAKNGRSADFPQAVGKTNKQHILNDDPPNLDALQTLAELSLMLELPTAETVESSRESVNGADKKVDSDAALRDESAVRGYMRKRKSSAPKERVSGEENTAGDTIVDSPAHSDSKFRDENIGRKYKRKCKSQAPQRLNHKLEEQINSHSSKLVEVKVSAEGRIEATDGFQQDNRMYTPSGQFQLVRSSDVSSCNGHRTTDADVAVLSEQVGMSSHILQPLRGKNRHKAEGAIFDKCPQSGSRDSPCRLSTSSHGNEVPLKDKLSIRFSCRKFRRWCAFEWFYSAIDYPWFAQKEFVAYLNHVGLGHIPRLMHVEWGVIRSSLGRPRRFSERFLLKERDKLAQYRESVRRLYAELRAGSREGLPSDVAQPLSVGQRVIAIHPKTKEFHDGKILTVDYDKYRIQFDLPELGVEMVKDIECMRLNSVENMPDGRCGLFPDVNSKGSEVKGRSIFPSTEHFDGVDARNGIPSPGQSLKNQRKVDGSIGLRDKAKVYVSQKVQSGTQILSSSVVQFQSREGSKQPMSELIYNSENKLEFSQANFEQPSPYPANLYSSSQPSTDSAGPSRTPCSPSSYSHGAQDLENTLVEIIKASRKKVHGVVETLVKATSSVKGGESMIASVIESPTVKNACEPATSSQGPALTSHNQMASTTLQQQQIDDNSGVNSHEGCERVEQVSTEALHWCLATFDVVQNCSARLHPPAEAAQLLDTAVKSLHLCGPQNLSVLRDIEMLMGRVKTQALTFVPSIGSHC